MRFLPLLLLLCASLSGQAWQLRIDPRVRLGDSTQLHLLSLYDYSQLLGVVYAVDADNVEIRLRSMTERVFIPTARMRYLGLFVAPRLITDLRGVPERVPLSDLTLVRTALPYRGQQWIKSVMLLYNCFGANLGEHVQLGIGIAGPLGLLLSQRYRTSLTDWLHVGLSHEIVTFPLVSDASNKLPLAGDATTLVTVGSSRQFFTFGAGLFYSSGDGDSPFANYRLGLGTQLGVPTHLYVEAVVFSDKSENFGVVPSLNLSIARRRHRWTFGLATALTDGDLFAPAPIPYLSYTLYD